MIKSFRGQLADGEQDTIRLATNNGLTGYKIIKFQLMHVEPGEQHAEHTVKLFTYEQETIDNTVDFDNSELLAAAYLFDNPDNAYPVGNVVVFDHVKFNQDIYITHTDTITAGVDSPCNYYIELEQFNLAVDEAAVATLKDMRGSN